MITLLLAIIESDIAGKIVGIVLSVGEALIVVLTLLSYFVEPESKFGKVLNKLLRGLFRAKNHLRDDINKSENKEENKDADNSTTK